MSCGGESGNGAVGKGQTAQECAVLLMRGRRAADWTERGHSCLLKVEFGLVTAKALGARGKPAGCLPEADRPAAQNKKTSREARRTTQRGNYTVEILRSAIDIWLRLQPRRAHLAKGQSKRQAARGKKQSQNRPSLLRAIHAQW